MTLNQPAWRKSSHSHVEACVEVAFTDSGVYVRDTKNPCLALRFTHAEWTAFLAGARGGEFDLP